MWHPSEPIYYLTRTSGLPLSLTCFFGHFCFFHLGCLVFELLDKKGWLAGYKEFKGDQQRYLELLSQVLFNQFFILLPAMFLSETFGIAFDSLDRQNQPLRHSVWEYIPQAAWMTIGHDLFFYLGHRFLLHSAWGYHFFRHDVHHSTKASIALSSMYMASSDYLLEICVPYLVPLCLLKADAAFHFFAIALGSLGGMYEHSGYNFWPRLPGLSTMAHGMHHTRYNCSFSDGVGSSNIMDGLFRTSYEHVYPKWSGKKSIKDPVM
ncbi:hypothetical protein F1559_001556 [Cyanidiococcus yangmingshanensis]|uniref:Fatty acid hydroxylase domain-containing protein n=1 Tax=Cyanidiococcus yangmingshanensis TaxID=2690220 RepID=A0A7J7ILE0_9RHOD|nr:hypothetical protein F1559_001556 [Cyanidiococcus yangmingshanensis]